MSLLLHPQTQKQLASVIAAKPHAIALLGDAGAGKGHVSRYIAAELLEIDVDKLSSSPYLFVLDVNLNKIGIEEVRSVQSFLKLQVPGRNAIRRAIIIEGIDKLGHEAQNALLKTIEEPPKDTVIIITIAQRNAVLQTIHSRVQHVHILPVDLDGATAYYKDSQAPEAIVRAFHMSNGEVGLMAALLDSDVDHPLVAAVQEARKILAASRYQRLAMVDRLAKDKHMQPAHLLDGLYRLVNASYKQALKTKGNSDLKPVAARMVLIENALSDLQRNVQTKLVLSRLFLEF